MKSRDRWNYLKQSGRLTRDILIRGRYDFRYDLLPVHSSQMPLKKRVNLLRAGVNLIYRRRHPWSWPIHMHIELTNYCNLRCPVCPAGSGILQRQPASIDVELFERLMDEVGPYLLTLSLWGWGESMLHPQLADILRIVQNRGITLFLSTNGQNLDDEKVQRALIDYPPHYLFVCLDGLTDETNSMNRVGAKIAPALAGVRDLVQMRHERNSQLPSLQLRYIAMKQNEHEIPQLLEFALENQFDELVVRTLSIIDAPEDAHRQLVPDDGKLQ
jgi:MoaA/NifB/PqqE/SkfB family radical SAM enzyme